MNGRVPVDISGIKYALEGGTCSGVRTAFKKVIVWMRKAIQSNFLCQFFKQNTKFGGLFIQRRVRFTVDN